MIRLTLAVFSIRSKERAVRDLKGMFTQKNMVISDVGSDKIGKYAVDSFSILLLVLKIFAFQVEKLVIWRQPS